MFKLIKIFFQDRYRITLNNIKLYIDKQRFKNAKKRAIEYHLLKPKQYHVIKQAGKYTVVDNRWVDYYNKVIREKGGKKITVYELMKIAYFSTN